MSAIREQVPRVVGEGIPPHPGDTVRFLATRGLFQGEEGGKWYINNGPGRVSLIHGINVTIECPGGAGHEDGGTAQSE